MKWVLGQVDCSRALSRDIAWRQVREPDDELTLALSIPIGASLCVAVLVLWSIATSWTGFAVDEWTMLGAFAVVATTHEVVHVAAFPRSPGRRCISFACSASCLELRAGYDGVMPRNRLLWVLGAPLFSISVLPVGASAALGSAPGFIVVLTLLNALASSGDLLAIVLVLAQVPECGLMRVENAGLLWRPRPSAPPREDDSTLPATNAGFA
jgi:hypothetical protein